MRTRRFWLISSFIGGLAVIVLNDYLRRHVAIQNDMAEVILGSLPNFVAGLTLPALVMSDLARIGRFSRMSGKSLGLASGIVSQALLIAWELAQSVWPHMVFDAKDILATLAGGLVWALVWPSLDRSLPAA